MASNAPHPRRAHSLFRHASSQARRLLTTNDSTLRFYYHVVYRTRDALVPWQHSGLGGFAFDYVSACIPQFDPHSAAPAATRIPFDALYDEAMRATDKQVGDELAPSATARASIG